MKQLLISIFILLSCLVYGANRPHPNMLLTKKNISEIRKQYKQFPLFANEVKTNISNADMVLNQKFDVPEPKGKGGSYSHTTHLDNASAFLNCGVAYQITGNEKYARFVIDGLKMYASKYKSFGRHPNCTQGYAGVLFFQELNENVWMVRVAQAYDCVYDQLTAEERTSIENELFEPMVRWASVENKRTFNLMHNHATWGNAAVGMLGYATGNAEWVKMALYGTKEDGSGGFLKQLESLFSPEGYYDEGPYYHRYALMPFVVFANVINNYEPERKIFEYRNAILQKAVDAILQLSIPGGMLFHFNDADKDAAITDEGIVYAVNIAYSAMGKNPELLDIASRQGVVTLSDAGFQVARDLLRKKSYPFSYKTSWFGDGADGTHGGVAVLREGAADKLQTAVLKASSQGQGHGHYDRLNLLWYDGSTEVFGDYGFARYVDIESKRGGEYLPENSTFAKQTVVHNTLTVDQKSHFQAYYATSIHYSKSTIFGRKCPRS
jgi:oligo-alginate lyase